MAKTSTNMLENEETNRLDSSQHIKLVALRLFAEHGIDGVTIREIAKAAGQKNHAAVGYHFGTKEALVKEIIVDGAKIIDQRRQAMLDNIKENGGPNNVRQIVDALIYPCLAPFDDVETDYYMRFTVILNMTHRKLFIDSIGTKWNQSYQECLTHLRRLMPDLPNSTKNQRLMFLGGYIAMMLALRQTALSDTSREHSTWPSEVTLRHIAHTASAIIEAPENDDSNYKNIANSSDDNIVVPQGFPLGIY